MYIYLLNLVTGQILVPTVFFSQFSDPLSLRYSSSFILSSFFHLHPPHVDQVSNIDSCPSNTFLKSLGVAVRLKITI